jgi:hypothetical protein
MDCVGPMVNRKKKLMYPYLEFWTTAFPHPLARFLFRRTAPILAATGAFLLLGLVPNRSFPVLQLKVPLHGGEGNPAFLAGGGGGRGGNGGEEEQGERGVGRAGQQRDMAAVVWTSLGPLPRWVPGPTTRWAPGTTRLALHGT